MVPADIEDEKRHQGYHHKVKELEIVEENDPKEKDYRLALQCPDN